MRRIVIGCCALLLGCGGNERAVPGATADSSYRAAADTSALTSLDCGTFLDEALRVVPTRAALAEAFGEPDSMRAWTEPNRHIPDVLDSVIVVRYPGLDVVIRKPHGGLDMPDLAKVMDNRFLTRAGIGVGAPEDRVVTVLGEPAERLADRLRYACGEVGAPVTFMLTGGKVRAIELDYYVD